MIHSVLKPCCYQCNTPYIETERIEHAPYDISYIIYCEHACVCKHYDNTCEGLLKNTPGDTSNQRE